MLLAGSAAGLTLPPVVTAICAEVVKGRRALATTVVNAGTSAGIVASAPLALLAYGDWRVAYLLFALVAGITTLGIFAATPAIVSACGVSSQKARVSLRVFWEAPRVRALIISAFLCGIVLAPYWTFGGEILAQQAGWSGEEIGFLWMVLGAAGLFGAVSGALVRRFGVGKVHDASFVLMSASLFLLMLSPINPWFPLIGAALQSSSYMSLSGAYLVWGVDDVPKDPAGITAATFFMMPLGLALGAYVFGHGLAMFGAGPMLWLFGLFTLSGLLLYQHDRSFLASVPA